LVRDAEHTVAVSAVLAYSVGMTCFGAEQDCGPSEVVDSHTSSEGIAGGKAKSSDPFEDDSKADILDVVSSAQA
jgi:hypothetical protein